MAMAAAEIEHLLREAFPDADVTLTDVAGDGDHYAAYVASTAFKGKTRVHQHQMVYAALQGKMGDALHALALTTAVKEACAEQTPLGTTLQAHRHPPTRR